MTTTAAATLVVQYINLLSQKTYSSDAISSLCMHVKSNTHVPCASTHTYAHTQHTHTRTHTQEFTLTEDAHAYTYMNENIHTDVRLSRRSRIHTHKTAIDIHFNARACRRHTPIKTLIDIHSIHVHTHTHTLICNATGNKINMHSHEWPRHSYHLKLRKTFVCILKY